MREYKFRAWDRYHQEMINWKQYKGEMVSNDFEDDDLMIMQWIGLKDKKGVCIYEGDIIQYKEPNRKYLISYWGETIGGWAAVRLPKNLNMFARLNGLLAKETEIIGNIFENPELIKGANNG